MKLNTINVKGRKFEVEVNQDTCEFYTVDNHDQITADSLQALKEKLVRRMSRASLRAS